MRSLLLRSALVSLAFSAALPAAAQSNADLKARCEQLTAYYDRYGVDRSENSDGARNHTRIGAGIDCANGHAAEGVAAMEELLKDKKFDAPPPTSGVAQSPRQ